MRAGVPRPHRPVPDGRHHHQAGEGGGRGGYPRLTGLLGVFSDPARDPRFHTISAVYTAEAEGDPAAGSDAAEVGSFTRGELPSDIAFDHRAILEEYFQGRRGVERHPAPPINEASRRSSPRRRGG